MSYSEMPPPDSRLSSPQKEGGELEVPPYEDELAQPQQQKSQVPPTYM